MALQQAGERPVIGGWVGTGPARQAAGNRRAGGGGVEGVGWCDRCRG